MIDYTVKPEQLADIADEGFRCSVDTAALCRLALNKEVNQLTYTEAVRLLAILATTPSFP